MLDRLKENILLCFSLSLVASYFGCLGYFYFFSIDISSFLSIQDLTMIFARWIWLSLALVAFTVIMLYKISDRLKNENTWWDQTIGKSNLKRRVLVILPIVIAIVILAFVYKIISTIITGIFGFSMLLIFILALVETLYSKFKDKQSPLEVSRSGWFFFITTFYFFIFVIPSTAGAIFAQNLNPDKIHVIFDSGERLTTNDSSQIRYIGKTMDYFFINDITTKRTTVYRMDKVKSFEIEKSK